MTSIYISDEISLSTIRLEDHEQLLLLMRTIYPPPYHHMWADSGRQYVETTFGIVHLTVELQIPDTHYYFVHFNKTVIGILRIVDNLLPNGQMSTDSCKLHRIYLHPDMTGLGIGEKIITWTSIRAQNNGCSIIWLEAMDTQSNAVKFYQKMGFQIIERFSLIADHLLSDYSGMYRMTKPL